MTNIAQEAIKASIRHARSALFLPRPHATEGAAMMENVSRFAGPGWSGVFRARPSTPFDLSAKIHDIHYAANRINFWEVLRIRGRRVHDESARDLLSRAAKADYLFMIMNDLVRPWQPGAEALNYGARVFFIGDQIASFARRKDGFVNVLLDTDLMSELNDPEKYLMIPESEIPRISAVPGPRTSDPLRENPIDRHPGFSVWFRARYGSIWKQIESVNSDPLTMDDIVGRSLGPDSTRVIRCF